MFSLFLIQCKYAFFSVCGTVIWFLRFTTNLLKCPRSYGDCNFFRLSKINVGLNALIVYAKQSWTIFFLNVDFFATNDWTTNNVRDRPLSSCRLTKILVPFNSMILIKWFCILVYRYHWLSKMTKWFRLDYTMLKFK